MHEARQENSPSALADHAGQHAHSGKVYWNPTPIKMKRAQCVAGQQQTATENTVIARKQETFIFIYANEIDLQQ